MPLVAMARAHARLAHPSPFRLLYSVRTPESAFYARELAALAGTDGLDLELVYTRAAPAGSARAAGRLTRDLLEASVFAPDAEPTVYVCGPTRFVETVADWLVAAGHPPSRVRTERFGGT